MEAGLCTQVSVTFPFFSTVVAIIAALGDLAGAYALPALFVLVRAGSPSRTCWWRGCVGCLAD